MVCVTYGVGALSALNAVAGAYAEDLPVVIIAGERFPSNSGFHQPFSSSLQVIHRRRSWAPTR